MYIVYTMHLTENIPMYVPTYVLMYVHVYVPTYENSLGKNIRYVPVSAWV